MSDNRKDDLSALEVVTEYSAAIAAANTDKMKALQSADYLLDWVYADAFENPARTAQEMDTFWPAWFAGFPDMDYEVTRTIAAEEVVVVQWVFTGTNTGTLMPPAFREPREPTGRIIQIRGVSIYDVRAGLISCETTYIDLATLMVELGIVL
ncbi:MAG: ester cyclase [Chloroflexi bacterium]|nr:ester cyclase [Chloroflexota bacterium]